MEGSELVKKTEHYKLNKPDPTDYINVEDFNENADIIDAELKKKVEKVAGKVLSENDFTDAEKQKIADNTEHSNDELNPHNVTKDQLGLDKVENKTANEIRKDSSKVLRTEVIDSLPHTASKGQIIFDDSELKFKGYDGGKWI